MLVYSLSDPISNEIKYIGITSQTTHKRLGGHIRRSREKKESGKKLSRKDNWILSLDSKGLSPIISVIYDNLDESEAAILEAYLISKYGRVYTGGQLLNVQTGGFFGDSGATPWNKGLKGQYSMAYRDKLSRSQRRAKSLYVWKDGVFIGRWNSIMGAARELGLFREYIYRRVKSRKAYKGYKFSYEPELKY